MLGRCARARCVLTGSIDGGTTLIRFCFALIVYFVTLANADAAEHKRVVILHSFGREFKPWKEYANAIRTELDQQSPWTLDVQEHSLVTARSTDPSPEAAFVEYLRTLYVSSSPDLIVCVGAPAALFIQRYRSQLFPAVPTLFTAVEQRRIQFSTLTENDTVVAVRHDFRFLFESFLRIKPETRVIAMVNGNSANELVWQNEMRRELKPLEARVDIRWYNTLSYDEILKQIATLPENSAIFWFQMIIDGAGVAHAGDRPLTQLFSAAKTPIFTTDEAFFGRDIIGGPMHSPREVSKRTAAVAVRLLGGDKPVDVKTPSSDFSPPRYDWRELQRWNVSERLLPPGSAVDFREPTAWEVYRWQIALVAAVILMQAGLIAVLLREHRRRQFAEVQSRQRMAELAHVNRFSTAGELTASIAHEINSPLGSILMNAETARAMLKSPSPDVAELIEMVEDIVRDDRRASEVIRRMKSLLTKAPFELKNLDLNDVVRETLDFVSSLAIGRKVELTSLTTQNALPILGDRTQLQQVILNLVVNGIDAMKDTPAANRIISVRTSRVGEFAELSVSDRGTGIPEDKLKEIFEPFFTSKAEGMGMGLSVARTIIEAHRGQISAKNRDHGGASFKIRLPLTKI
jgi:signal transduction histidine kinase